MLKDLDPSVRGFIARSRSTAYIRGINESDGSRAHLRWEAAQGPLIYRLAISVARSFIPPAIVGTESVGNQDTGEAIQINYEGILSPLKTVSLDQIFQGYVLALRAQPFILHQGEKRRLEFIHDSSKWLYEDSGFDPISGGNAERLSVSGRIARIFPYKITVYSGFYSLSVLS